MFKHEPIGTRGFTCDRCGRDYSISHRLYQDGLSVCDVVPCYDTPREQPKVPTMESPASIGEVLSVH